jgi:Kae1-associated kinase Bud32
MKKKIAQGAEAVIYEKDNNIIKDRIKKKYRIKEIDYLLRKQRTRRESKILKKSPISSPKLIKEEKTKIMMEKIHGKRIRDLLDNNLNLVKEIAESISKLHDNNIIHGDLTTSNMILNQKNNKVYFIDFGLSFISHKTEDKAVDIHLFKQALESKHYKAYEKALKLFIKNYNPKNKKNILKRLEKVEKRGRYKTKG